MQHIFRPLAVSLLIALLASCGRSPDYYYNRGKDFAAKGKYADAVLNYSKAIQKNPSYGEAFAELGQAELHLGHTRQAYDALTRAVQILPKRRDIKVSLADLALGGYLADQRRPKVLYNQLTKISDELLAEAPASYEGLRIKAYLAASDNQLDKALEFFELANTAKPMQPALVLAWVDVLFRADQPDKGEKLALELIQKEKTYGPIYDVLARQYLARNRTPDAEKLLQTKIANNPKNAGAAIELATFYLQTGRQDQMKAALGRLLNNPGDFPQARLDVGDFYAFHQEWDPAIEQYRLGADADSKQKVVYLKRITNVYLAQGKGEQASAIVDQIRKEKPDDDEARAVEASLLLKAGGSDKINRALTQFQDLVKRNPDNAVWLFNLGQAYAANGDSKSAVAQFQAAIQKRPDYIPPRLALAEISLSRRDYQQALQYANDALRLRPGLVRAMLLHSAALIGSGKYGEAAPELARLEKALPRSPDVQLQLAAFDLVQKRFKPAEERYRKVYDEDPKNTRALAGLIETYSASNRLDEAFRFLTNESKKPAAVPEVRSSLAQVALRLGKNDVAIEQYKTMLQSNPNSAELHERLGSVYSRAGNAQDALAQYESATHLAPQDPTALAFLASALENTGRRPEAIADYRRVLQMQPENAVAMNNLAFLIAETGGNLDEAQDLVQRAIKKAPQQPNFSDTLGWIYLKKGHIDAALQTFRPVAQKYPQNQTFQQHLALAEARMKTEPRP